MTALPDTLSGLLRTAVEDAKKCQEDPRYKLHMGYWHIPAENRSVCTVCMAGAVMAQRLDIPPDEDAAPGDDQFDGPTGNKLRAIDYMRVGDLVCAAEETGIRAELTEEQDAALVELEKRMLAEYIGNRGNTPSLRLEWERYEYYADQLELIERMAT